VDKTGTLTSNRLSVEEIVPVEGSEADLRALLGDVVASAAFRNKTAEAIASACPGTARPLARDVPFSSARKWSAVAFAPGTGPGRTGVVAMGAAEFLRPALGGGIGDAAAWATLRARIEPHTSRGLRVLVVASYADPGGLAGDDDAPTLPAGMRPLGLVVLRDELRPDAKATLARFAAADVTVKVISGDDPETVVALAVQAGLGPDLRSIAGPALDAMDDEQLAAAALETTVFGRITPAQKERLVDALRSRGRYVAMIGDGVNDVLSLKKANLGIAMQSGSQAARGVADIVLTNDSFASLAPAVEEGQRILNGMQAILRLFLSRIMTVGLLVVTSLVIGIFPIALRNGSAVTLFTVGIPTVLLAVWAQPGARAHESLGRTLARFVVPAAALSSLAGLAVLFGVIVIQLGGLDALTGRGQAETAALDAAVAIAQSALTSFLVLAGLVLVVFVEPPVAWLAVIEPRSPDRRPTILAGVLAALYLLLLAVPAGRAVFALQPLGAAELAIVIAAVAAWAAALHAAWRYRVVERFLGI
jgi:cation-transporting ATPase E